MLMRHLDTTPLPLPASGQWASSLPGHSLLQIHASPQIKCTNSHLPSNKPTGTSKDCFSCFIEDHCGEGLYLKEQNLKLLKKAFSQPSNPSGILSSDWVLLLLGSTSPLCLARWSPEEKGRPQTLFLTPSNITAVPMYPERRPGIRPLVQETLSFPLLVRLRKTQAVAPFQTSFCLSFSPLLC